MPFTSHQHPTLGKYAGKFCENMIARPKLSTRLFSSLFSIRMKCACTRTVILIPSCSSCILESGQSRGGE